MENVYNFFNFENYYVNVFLSKHGYKNKPTGAQASVINYAFHKNFVSGKQKIQSTKLSTVVKNIKNNGIVISSTGKLTSTIFIDIDNCGNELYNYLLSAKNQIFSYKETKCNNKSAPKINTNEFFNMFLPSFWYETNSSTPENRRLRLVYLFFQRFDSEKLKQFVEKLNTILSFLFVGISIDKCSFNIKQLWFGTKKDVFINNKTRIYHIEESLNTLNKFIHNFKLDFIFFNNFIDNQIFRSSKNSQNLLLNGEIFEEFNSYEDALWKYVALFHLKQHKFFKTKQKWLKKFETTMKKRPFFKPKKNSMVWEIYKFYR